MLRPQHAVTLRSKKLNLAALLPGRSFLPASSRRGWCMAARLVYAVVCPKASPAGPAAAAAAAERSAAARDAGRQATSAPPPPPPPPQSAATMLDRRRAVAGEPSGGSAGLRRARLT
jgi:hypothetical protein